MIGESDVSPVTRSKSDAKSAYDKLSRWYNILASRGEEKARNTGLRELAVQKKESVLEVGCGTGKSIEALAESVSEDGEAVGIDLSTGMLNITRKRMRKAKLAGQVGLTSGDAVSLPFKDASFNAVFMSFTLELFDTPEIPLVLAECRRVLKRDGRLSIVAMSKMKTEKIPRMVKLYEWIHRKLPKYVDCRPIPLEEIMRNSGFTIIMEEQFSTWQLPITVALAKKTS